jgi:hypothetical protein
MKEESEFILLTFSLVVVGESELFSIGNLAACCGCPSNRQLALTLDINHEGGHGWGVPHGIGGESFKEALLPWT